jgi:hypothetical protein
MVAAVGGGKNFCFDALDALSRRGPMVIGASCVDSNLAYGTATVQRKASGTTLK